MQERKSRFYGSHTAAAWARLAMIFGVIATLLLYRGAQVDTGDFPYGKSLVAVRVPGPGRGILRVQAQPPTCTSKRCSSCSSWP